MASVGRVRAFGSNLPTGSGQAQGSLHFIWYQSLGLGISGKRGP